jgi:carbamoyltransferase
MLYSAFTYYTGFKVNSGEYKLMGLAPYGRPLYRDLILERWWRLGDDGSLGSTCRTSTTCEGVAMTSERFHELFGGPPRPPRAVITQKEMDLASSIQAVCEEVVLKAADHVHRLTGARSGSSWPGAWR